MSINSNQEESNTFIRGYISDSNVNETLSNRNATNASTSQTPLIHQNNNNSNQGSFNQTIPTSNIPNPMNHIPFYNPNDPNQFAFLNPNITNFSPFYNPNIPFLNPNNLNHNLNTHNNNLSYINLLTNQSNPLRQHTLEPTNNFDVGQSSHHHEDPRDTPHEDHCDAAHEARHGEVHDEEARNEEAPRSEDEDLHTPLPWNAERRKFATNERNPKCGISATIRKIFETKFLPFVKWSEVPKETQEWYWKEFKKYYKWPGQYEQDVRKEWEKRCARRYSDRKNKLIDKQKKLWRKENSNQGDQCTTSTEPLDLPRPSCTPLETWRAWLAHNQTTEFKKKSLQGQLNRRRGNLQTDALPTYRDGSLSANRLREQYEDKHLFFCCVGCYSQC